MTAPTPQPCTCSEAHRLAPNIRPVAAEPHCIAGCGRTGNERLLGGAPVCTCCRDRTLRWCQLMEIAHCYLQPDHVRACAAYLDAGRTMPFRSQHTLQIYKDRVDSIIRAGGPHWL